jgi:2-hydroxy-4-(methylsulfanyl)butanoate S-methyltransferase
MPTVHPGTPVPVSDRRELSAIAYGFMASKALFAALSVDLFTHVEAGRCSTDELAAGTGVAPNRMQTLLHALAGLGLLVPDGSGYRNAPACRRYLVAGSPGDFGDYFRLQVAGQIYPALVHLDDGLAGTGAAFDTLGGLLAEPAQAQTFIDAQHAGSRGAAQVLAGLLDLADARQLLDVGGGSGAFSIALCERNPQLQAVVLDFPAVIDVAHRYRQASAAADRIELRAGDAVHAAWPPQQDVILLSYLLSALGAGEIDAVLDKARSSLRPGGLLVVHDFMLDDDRPGPALAALWFLQYVAYRGDAVSFSAAELGSRLRAHGFAEPNGQALIPDITKVLLTRRLP